MVLLGGLSPRRLWSTGTGSMPKTASGKHMPYPEEIEIDHDAAERIREREELKYWKEKALRLEGSIGNLEESVTSLERRSSAGDGSLEELPSRAHSAPAMPMGRLSPTASPVSSSKSKSNPLSSSMPPSHKSTESDEKQRKDEIMQQLVSEMERIIKLHTNDVTGEDDDGTEGTGDDSNPPARKPMIIETSALERLVTQALSAEKDESVSVPAAENEQTKEKRKRKHKNRRPHQELYQLSCKHCIGQNFVGSTKNDLKDKVKKNYAVVWQVVQTAYGEGDCDIVGSGHDHSLSFRASSFSHHIARHCRECKSEEGVYQWCLKNIKVERISKHPLNRCDSI
mmetsp:Transcript_21442/g.46580  ORF Transcript_21442/g.46580 Transcript_21442/m.46580 type:complete len:340 (-) Transcript_21442:116-1135(-)